MKKSATTYRFLLAFVFGVALLSFSALPTFAQSDTPTPEPTATETATPEPTVLVTATPVPTATSVPSPTPDAASVLSDIRTIQDNQFKWAIFTGVLLVGLGILSFIRIRR